MTRTGYDPMDRPVTVVGPDNSSGGNEETRTAYDDAGRVIRVIAPKGTRTAFVDDYTTVTGYDLLDRPTTVSRYELDGSGAIIAAKTRTSVYCYDAAGDLRSATGPKGATGFSCPSATAWPYTPTTQPFTVRFGYDEAHRQTSLTDALGRESLSGYDANGAVTTQTDAAGKVSQSFYTDRGELERVVTPFETGRGLTEKTEYDALGNVKRQISSRAWDAQPGGPYTYFVTEHAYDKLNRLVKTTLPRASASEPISYTHSVYDANGRLAWTSLPTLEVSPSSVAAADRTTSEYWDSGGIYATTVGGAAKTRFDYTAEGWQAWRLPETGEGTGIAAYDRLMFWDYYPDGLLRAERDLSGRRSSYSYDANGNQTSAAEAQSIVGEVLSIDSSFDGFDQLTKVRTPKAGSGNYWASSWAYDRHGNIETLVENQEETSAAALIAAGRTFAYFYDDADQPQQQTDDFATPGSGGDDERFSFGFDSLGRLASRTVAKADGSGGWMTEQSSSRSYYDNSLLKTLRTLDGAGAIVAEHTFAYVRDGVYANGNVVEDRFRLKSPDAGAPCQSTDCTASWTYDGRERLLSENTGTGSTSTFSLDVRGNVIAEQRNGAAYRTAGYTGNRLTSDTVAGISSRYLYDGLGSVDCTVATSWVSATCPAAATGQPVASELLTDNVYDYRSRLVAVRNYDAGALGDRSEYSYDPLSRPIKKTATVAGQTTTTELLYRGLESEIVRETETGDTTKTRSYAFDALGQRATITENGARYSYVTDYRSSVEALLDQANGVKAAYGYRAYGEANPSLTKTAAGFNSSTNSYRYTGKRFDPAAKAYDMGARHYLPAQGRWFQPDLYPSALADLGLSLDPLTSNRYQFTGANPINYIEIDGHVYGGFQYEDGGGSPDPDRQAALIADGFVQLGCTTGNANSFICTAVEEGVKQQVDVYKNRDLLCDQTNWRQHCSTAGTRELVKVAGYAGLVALTTLVPVSALATGGAAAAARGTIAFRLAYADVTVRVTLVVAVAGKKLNLDQQAVDLSSKCAASVWDAIKGGKVKDAVVDCGEMVVHVSGKG